MIQRFMVTLESHEQLLDERAWAISESDIEACLNGAHDGLPGGIKITVEELTRARSHQPPPTTQGPHPSHELRFSFDASSWDEICVFCGHTDQVPGGWGELVNPCPATPEMREQRRWDIRKEAS